MKILEKELKKDKNVDFFGKKVADEGRGGDERGGLRIAFIACTYHCG